MKASKKTETIATHGWVCQNAQMIRFVLFLLLLVGCESKQPTEEQLVADCQNRRGIPNVQVKGSFKCEMPKDQTQLAQRGSPPPSRY